MENKFFAATIFLIFGIFMVTSHLNFAIAADSESGDSGGDDKKDSGSKDDGGGDNDNDKGGDSDSKSKSDNDSDDNDKGSKDDSDKQQNKEGSDSNDNQDTQLSSSNDDNDKPSGDAIIKSTPPTSTPPTEEEKEKDKAESDVQQQDSADINDNSNSKPYYEKDAGDAIISDKPSKQQYEDEKAAIEDYIYDEPGKIKPYSSEGVKEPWKIKLIESLNSEAEQKIPQEQSKPALPDDPYEVCDVSDKCRGPGVKVDEKGAGSITNCIGYYCFGEEEKDVYEKIIKSGKCDGVKDSPKDKEDCLNNGGRGNGAEPEKNKCGGPWWIKPRQCFPDKHPFDGDKGKGDKGKDWWNQEGKHEHDYDDGHDHHDHNHHHHSSYCDYHNCHEHHHHSGTHFSDSHEGDVTVKIDLKYEEKSSKNLEDMFLFIGEDYDKNVDLSDKPDTIKVNHLDIDGGDTFAVCLANEDSQNGDLQ